MSVFPTETTYNLKKKIDSRILNKGIFFLEKENS